MDTKDYECNFGPSQVVMQTVDINVSTERYSEAVQAAKKMPNRGAGLAQVSQARHLLDQAAALTRMGSISGHWTCCSPLSGSAAGTGRFTRPC
ncbi:hypothetical protein AB4305_18425 [Nocardia sp. 2YAB30]|uniref:hypothetical protein n=1 Tax=unclassified Nocardia TaxID=2637762 RepID=UPI003F9C391E